MIYGTFQHDTALHPLREASTVVKNDGVKRTSSISTGNSYSLFQQLDFLLIKVDKYVT